MASESVLPVFAPVGAAPQLLAAGGQPVQSLKRRGGAEGQAGLLYRRLELGWGCRCNVTPERERCTFIKHEPEIPVQVFERDAQSRKVSSLSFSWKTQELNTGQKPEEPEDSEAGPLHIS